MNFKGIWLAMRAEIPAMLRNPNSGAIVNTSSVGGLRGGPDLSAYPEVAAWLLSDRASYVSGAVLAIDGGMTA